MGVEIDEYNRPVKYYFREASIDNYQVGQLIEIPADEIIHIFKHEFVGQTRGFGDIVASVDSLKQLDDYANQHNPNNHAYWDNLDNHANQCNPNNDAYWSSRNCYDDDNNDD